MNSNAATSGSANASLNQHLIEKCKNGDQKAQFQVFKMYYKAMYNTSFRIVNDSAEAEIIMQESFLSAFEKIDAFCGTVSFEKWLRSIVITMSFDSIKKNGKVIFDDIDISHSVVCHPIVDLSTECKTDLRVNEVVEASKRLPVGSRIVILLYFLEGYNHREVGALLSVSPEKASSRLSGARDALMRELKGN